MLSLSPHICQCTRKFFVKRPKFPSATSSLPLEKNLAHLGGLVHFSQTVVGVTINKPPGSSVNRKRFRIKHSQILADFLRFSTNLPFLLHRKVKGRYTGFLYGSLKELCCICLLVFENMANKAFHINSEYIKRINTFWGEIYLENCQLFISFYRFQFTLMYLEKSTFCVSQPAR